MLHFKTEQLCLSNDLIDYLKTETSDFNTGPQDGKNSSRRIQYFVLKIGAITLKLQNIIWHIPVENG